ERHRRLDPDPAVASTGPGRPRARPRHDRAQHDGADALDRRSLGYLADRIGPPPPRPPSDRSHPAPRGAADMVRPAARLKQIRRVCEWDRLVGPIMADPDRLQQTILNLLTNAVKFNVDGGSVTVRLRSISNAVEIAVTDTGQGIRGDF